MISWILLPQAVSIVRYISTLRHFSESDTVADMKLTNDSYVILMGTRNFTERYYRDKTGWLKVSARGRTFRMTAEQVLNHVLPALAGIKPNLTIKVEHRNVSDGGGRRSTADHNSIFRLELRAGFGSGGTRPSRPGLPPLLNDLA